MVKASTKEIIKKLIMWTVVCTLVVGLMPVFQNQVHGADSFETSISGFPESYKPYLRELHKKYPSWVFKPYNTGIDFSTAVANEASNNKSVMERSYNDMLKSRATGDYNPSTGSYIAKDGNTWISASKNTVAYFMDPRNFLSESFITMFETLSYDSVSHTQQGIEEILKGSFMYNTNICYLTSGGTYKTTTAAADKYSARILDAGKKSKVSPYYLASKILLEVGKQSNSKYKGMGAGNSVNGEYPGYKGIYNFYNIGANDGANAVANGLRWASSSSGYERPWNKPGKSILGGAKYIGETYINAGQDTTYFQRFNVRHDGMYSLYTHQYMTSIYGNAAESYSTAAAYINMGIMGKAKTFVIPVYNKMPAENTTVRIGNSSKTGTVNSIVNMRKLPDTSADRLTTLSQGDKVTVMEFVPTDVEYGVKWLNNPYWYKVQLSKGGEVYTGYVSANYVDLTPELNIIKDVAQKPAVSVSNSETVYYESDDPAIAVVDASGNITGKKSGTTTIRVYTQAGSYSSMAVNVIEKGVVLDDRNITLNLKQSKTLKATVYPTNTTNKKISWSSSNTKVATVTSAGVVTGKSVGSAIIYAKSAAGGVVGQCNVRVVKPVTGVTLNKKSVTLAKGTTTTLHGTITPSDATIKDVSWKSSNNKVATVKNGTVTAVSPGEATITVTTNNQNKTATCKIKVKPRKTVINKVTSKGNSTTISWNQVSDITGYRIYRKTANGDYKLIAKVSASERTYTDTQAVAGYTHLYRVAAYKTVSGKDYIASKSAAKSVNSKPSQPKITSVTKSGTKKAVIRWNRVDSAEGYVIYRRSGTTGKFVKAKTITSGKKKSYKNGGLKKNVHYYYKMKAYRTVNGKKIYSKYSKSVSIIR